MGCGNHKVLSNLNLKPDRPTDRFVKAKPRLMRRVRAEERRYRVELDKWEKGLPYDGAVIGSAHTAYLNAILRETEAAGGAVFSMAQVGQHGGVISMARVTPLHVSSSSRQCLSMKRL